MSDHFNLPQLQVSACASSLGAQAKCAHNNIHSANIAQNARNQAGAGNIVIGRAPFSAGAAGAAASPHNADSNIQNVTQNHINAQAQTQYDKDVAPLDYNRPSTAGGSKRRRKSSIARKIRQSKKSVKKPKRKHLRKKKTSKKTTNKKKRQKGGYMYVDCSPSSELCCLKDGEMVEDMGPLGEEETYQSIMSQYPEKLSSYDECPPKMTDEEIAAQNARNKKAYEEEEKRRQHQLSMVNPHETTPTNLKEYQEQLRRGPGLLETFQGAVGDAFGMLGVGGRKKNKRKTRKLKSIKRKKKHLRKKKTSKRKRKTYKKKSKRRR